MFSVSAGKGLVKLIAAKDSYIYDYKHNKDVKEIIVNESEKDSYFEYKKIEDEK